jgi:hypothetical protein
MVLKPIIILSRVVFPHPDGPKSVKNSPGLISAESPWMTILPPYAFVTLLICIETPTICPFLVTTEKGSLAEAAGLPFVF